MTLDILCGNDAILLRIPHRLFKFLHVFDVIGLAVSGLERQKTLEKSDIALHSAVDQ